MRQPNVRKNYIRKKQVMGAIGLPYAQSFLSIWLKYSRQPCSLSQNGKLTHVTEKDMIIWMASMANEIFYSFQG